MNDVPLFQMSWTRSQRLLGVGFAVVGLAIAADRVLQPNPGVMEMIGILVSLLVVLEVLSRATAAIEVTSEAVRSVGGHMVRTIPLSGVAEVKRHGDGVRSPSSTEHTSTSILRCRAGGTRMHPAQLQPCPTRSTRRVAWCRSTP